MKILIAIFVLFFIDIYPNKLLKKTYRVKGKSK